MVSSAVRFCSALSRLVLIALCQQAAGCSSERDCQERSEKGSKCQLSASSAQKKSLEFFSAQKKSIEFFSLRNRFLFRAESMHKCEHVTKTVFIFCLVGLLVRGGLFLK